MNFDGGAHNATPDSKPTAGGLGPVVAVSAFILFSIAASAAVVIHLRARDTQAPQTLDDESAAVAAASVLPTPPVFAAPLTVPDEARAATPVAVSPAPPIPNSRAFERAKELTLDGRDSEARALLEPRVRAGRGSPEETMLLKMLCKKQHDMACLDDIKSKHLGP